jgi:hypothetical protein
MPPEQPNTFMTVFTTGHLSHTNPVQTLKHFLLQSTLMFSSLCVGLPSVLLFSIILKSYIQVSCLTNASCLCLSHLQSHIFCRVQIMKLLIIPSSPSSCHFLPLGPKHSLQQHSKYSQSMFFVLGEK